MARRQFNFDPNKAQDDRRLELEKLEKEIEELGGWIVGMVEWAADAVKLDDTDPLHVQIDAAGKIRDMLRTIATAVQRGIDQHNRDPQGSQPVQHTPMTTPTPPQPTSTRQPRRAPGPRTSTAGPKLAARRQQRQEGSNPA